MKTWMARSKFQNFLFFLKKIMKLKKYGGSLCAKQFSLIWACFTLRPRVVFKISDIFGQTSMWNYSIMWIEIMQGWQKFREIKYSKNGNLLQRLKVDFKNKLSLLYWFEFPVAGSLEMPDKTYLVDLMNQRWRRLYHISEKFRFALLHLHRLKAVCENLTVVGEIHLSKKKEI